MSGPEYTHVEAPFIDQLVSMGWKFTSGNLDHPSATGRESFREVILETDLRRMLRRINVDESGEPWLDDDRISQAVSALTRVSGRSLMEANQAATALLLSGVAVEGPPAQDGGRARTVHFVDWEHPENNEFRVVNQFRVDEPGGHVKGFIAADLVLFVNGIPLVVVECKAPLAPEPIATAIDQLRRYSNQRNRYEEDEGNERLFHTNQFLVATCFDEARAGTICSPPRYFFEWKDTSPVPTADVAAALGKPHLSSQERLVAGMLRPANLLDIVRHFTLFMQEDGKTFKAISRYQQFRAVQNAVHRLLTGKTRREDGEHDRRGGIVWHTQGSGKSLTMVFLIRKMRSTPELRAFKVVAVTDRTDLQRQLTATAGYTDESVRVATNTKAVRDLLSNDAPGIVFAMIQKYRDEDVTFPNLNESERILVLVDEAHRSHASSLHANLLAALPNAARIGFTGTPIIMGAKKRTHEIFGDFVDRYTLRESEADGSTVPILYEGRTVSGIVKDAESLDALFEDFFEDRTPQELELLKQKYATRGDVLEAEKLIAAKARDIFAHYVDNILPNGLKAQVVANSRRAAVRYRDALLAARDEMVAEIEALDPLLLSVGEKARAKLNSRTQLLLRAQPYLDLIRTLDAAPVISGAHNDDPAWAEWSDGAKIKDRIARFKRRLGPADTERESPVAFLLVKSMLLTGFDAPVEQAMYLDRAIKEAELLQAIARVNRSGPEKKRVGIVVDYFGVARHLHEALKAYDAADVEGALRSIKEELPNLRDSHLRALAIFHERGLADLSDVEACIHLLRDGALRAEFVIRLKGFLGHLDTVLPRPEALPFVDDAERLAEIHARARRRYRDPGPILDEEDGAKVAALIDRHLVARGIDPRIPPIEILDATFTDHVTGLGSDRSRASEMEHAIRYHIRKHLDQDPVHYQALSERLDTILREFEGRWDELVQELEVVVSEARAGRQQDDTGLDAHTQAPFYAVLAKEVAGGGEPSPALREKLCELTVEVVEHIRQEIRIVDFWKNTNAQEVLRSEIFEQIDRADVLAFERLDAVADRLMELAKAKHNQLAGV